MVFRSTWSAIDVGSYGLLAIRASGTRGSMDAYIILRRTLKACVNRPLILVDGAPWYKWALERLGLKWGHRAFGGIDRGEGHTRDNPPPTLHPLYNKLRCHQPIGGEPSYVAIP